MRRLMVTAKAQGKPIGAPEAATLAKIGRGEQPNAYELAILGGEKMAQFHPDWQKHQREMQGFATLASGPRRYSPFCPITA